MALFACFANPDFRSAVWATALFLFLSVGYFVLFSRTRLVAQAPEEEIALAAAAADARADSH